MQRYCNVINSSHLEKLIAKNKCSVRPERSATREIYYHSPSDSITDYHNSYRYIISHLSIDNGTLLSIV